MGGDIWAKSELAKGTSVFISLKKAEEKVNYHEKILLIEDEVSIAELQRDYLEINGFTVDIQHHGEDGLQQALNGNYDLIILDIMLPGISGFDICKQIRAVHNIPILFVSAKKRTLIKFADLD